MDEQALKIRVRFRHSYPTSSITNGTLFSPLSQYVCQCNGHVIIFLSFINYKTLLTPSLTDNVFEPL